MNLLTQLVRQLNKNKLFKYLSSVRLAVPLMLVLAFVVAIGTVVESRYNSEYAGMIIYKSTWFGFLLILLWINIFSATISRIPFKKHHTGFVITHIGLLTLLIGSHITNQYGLDGQLSVMQGQISSSVVLPGLMIAYKEPQKNHMETVKFKKSLFNKSESSLDYINDDLGPLFKVSRYVPFAKVNKSYKSSGDPQKDEVALSFILKSNFFNVSEWLNSKKNPIMQLGPATLKIKKTSNLNESSDFKFQSVQTPVRKTASDSKSKVVILDLKSHAVVKEFDLEEFSKGQSSFKNLKFKKVKIYKSAVVAANKLEESLDPQTNNPAVEFFVDVAGQEKREVLYAKFSHFSLNPNGISGYQFAYKNSKVTASDDTLPAHSGKHESSGGAETANESFNVVDSTMSSAAMDSMGSRVIEFLVNPLDISKVKVNLYKNNQKVLSQIVSEGQSIQTPWMGMQIFVGSIQAGLEQSDSVTEINPEMRSELPPSAIEVQSRGNESQWLIEGDEKEFFIDNKVYNFYFGREYFDLPFDITLQEFRKIDYPGTETAMSFESDVKIGQSGIVKTISMNEPLKKAGYTIYQASYIMNPNQPPVSVFSVNYDPGRTLKYIGSIILALGVVIFTYMRSRLYKGKAK